MKHLRDVDGVIHCVGAVAAGEFSLCGLALEGERGDTPMIEIHKSIDCRNCIATIEHCKSIRNREIRALFRQRRA